MKAITHTYNLRPTFKYYVMDKLQSNQLTIYETIAVLEILYIKISYILSKYYKLMWGMELKFMDA